MKGSHDLSPLDQATVPLKGWRQTLDITTSLLDRGFHGVGGEPLVTITRLEEVPEQLSKKIQNQHSGSHFISIPRWSGESVRSLNVSCLGFLADLTGRTSVLRVLEDYLGEERRQHNLNCFLYCDCLFNTISVWIFQPFFQLSVYPSSPNAFYN